VRSDTVVHELQFAVLVNTLDLVVHRRHQSVGRAIARADDLGLRLPGVPSLDEQLARGYSRRRCQVGVARISGQMASPVTGK
jgi:hypothetical protein